MIRLVQERNSGRGLRSLHARCFNFAGVVNNRDLKAVYPFADRPLPLTSLTFPNRDIGTMSSTEICVLQVLYELGIVASSERVDGSQDAESNQTLRRCMELKFVISGSNVSERYFF
jgi:hypothetical protein